jgi:hypothetical protein
MLNLALVIGWIIAIFIAALEVIIVVFILTGKINIAKLISDENGDASLSRFQFLIFTFVVSMSLFYLIVSLTPPKFPEIPIEILGLLGISGGTYAIAKGIQASRDPEVKKAEAELIEAEAKAKQASGITNGMTGTPGSVRTSVTSPETKSDQLGSQGTYQE